MADVQLLYLPDRPDPPHVPVRGAVAGRDGALGVPRGRARPIGVPDALPPPPPDAFKITGKPTSRAEASAWSSSRSTPVPGSIGSPRELAVARAVTLSPHCLMASGVGPMKVMGHLRQTPAKAAPSDKNP